MADVVNLAVYLPHEGDGAVRHEVEDVNGCPGSSSVEVGRIRELVGCRALHENRSVREELSGLSVPFLDGYHVLLGAVIDSSVFVEFLAEKARDRNGQLVHPRDDCRSRHDDLSMLKHEPSPALSNKYEVWLLQPDLLRHLDEEWIRVSLHDVGVPVTVVFVPDYDGAFHKILGGVGWVSVIVDSLELLGVRLHDLWPGLTIIEMDTVYVSF